MIMLENGTSVSDFLLDLENDKSSYPTHENTQRAFNFSESPISGRKKSSLKLT